MARFRFLRIILVSGLLLLAEQHQLPATAVVQEPKANLTRMACVGDSITAGVGTKDRTRDSYPRQLAQLLADKWEVTNFGVSGATLLKKGDKPYWKQKAFQQAQAFKPDVVVLMLGTNDSKPQNWKHKDEFEADCKEMLEVFAGLPSKPKVWICHPIPAFPGNFGIRDSVIKDEIIPIINKVAQEKKVGIIDMYQALAGKGELVPDKVHPNTQGAALMADAAFKALTTKK